MQCFHWLVPQSKVNNHCVLCTVKAKKEQKYTTKKFVRFHNHSCAQTNYILIFISIMPSVLLMIHSIEQNPFATLSMHSLKKCESLCPHFQPQCPTEIKGENDKLWIHVYYEASQLRSMFLLILPARKGEGHYRKLTFLSLPVASEHSAFPVTKV